METAIVSVQREQNITKPSSNVGGVNPPKYWARDYINKKISEEPIQKYKVFFLVMWFTGVRISECLGLTKKNLDFRNYTIQIKWLKNRKYNIRNIPMHPTLRVPLELYTAQMNAEDKLFTFDRHRAYDIVKRRFGGSPHQFRHSFAVNWLRCNGDLVHLHKMLGHNRIQTTMEYLKIVPVDIGRELLKINF